MRYIGSGTAWYGDCWLQTGKDSCNGDSGSPVVGCFGNSTWVLGVLVKGSELPRNGPACGANGRLAVYTRLEKYTEFIRTTINGGKFECANCHNDGGDSCTALTDSAPAVEPTEGCGEYRTVDSDYSTQLSTLQIVGICFGAVIAVVVVCSLYSWIQRIRAAREEHSELSETSTELRPRGPPRTVEVSSPAQGKAEYTVVVGAEQLPSVEVVTETVSHPVTNRPERKPNSVPKHAVQRGKDYGVKGDDLEAESSHLTSPDASTESEL